MEINLTSLVLVALIFVVAFNLFLTLRMASIVGKDADRRVPLSLPVGETLPTFEARTLIGSRHLSIDDMAGQATVLAFLSPMCKDCQARAGELAQMQDAMRRADVALWIIGMGTRWRLANYFRKTPLLNQVLTTSAATRRRLNPKLITPFYIFVDHQLIVQASSFMGDENWLSFVEQMHEEDLSRVA
jgi:hypothetical protein